MFQERGAAQGLLRDPQARTQHEAPAGRPHAWVTGLRREQSETRRRASFRRATPTAREVLPLADWTEADVWHYVLHARRALQPLHDRFCPSIGCAPARGPSRSGEDHHAGLVVGTGKAGPGVQPAAAGRTPVPVGRVIFIGAEGAADLITLRGARTLAAGRRGAATPWPTRRCVWRRRRWIDVGKRGFDHATAQATIDALLVRLAGEHALVVRSKGGDPKSSAAWKRN